jgi:hypothetical protein
MKLLNLIGTMLLLLSINVEQCENATVKKSQFKLLECAPKDHTPSKPFLNETAKVIDMREVQQRRVRAAFYLEATSVDRVYLYACNLPEQVKKHGLRVKISGHLLTFPGIEVSNREALICELTNLKVIGK